MLQQGADNGAATSSSSKKRFFDKPIFTSFRAGLVLGTIVTVAVALLIVQNGESSQLDWLSFEFKTPLWIMLLLTMLAGAIVWEFAKMGYRRGRANRARQRAGE